MNTIYELVIAFQKGDRESILTLLNIFKPLLKKYSKALNYDDAESELTAFFIEIVKKMPTYRDKNMHNDGCVVSYINTCIKNRYILLSKKNTTIASLEIPLDTDIPVEDVYCISEGRMFVDQLLDTLPSLQRKIIKQIYINDEKQSAVAFQLHVSRQAINQIKRRALKSLRKQLEKSIQ